MWKKFEKLAEANVNHYNEHPFSHGVMTGGLLVVSVACFGWLARSSARIKPSSKTYFND